MRRTPRRTSRTRSSRSYQTGSSLRRRRSRLGGARTVAPKTLETNPESDRFEHTPHPRESFGFFGHAETETGLLRSYLSGHLPQAFILGGPPGLGKATLAWRLARFLLANPDPVAAAGQARADLFV